MLGLGGYGLNKTFETLIAPNKQKLLRKLLKKKWHRSLLKRLL